MIIIRIFLFLLIMSYTQLAQSAINIGTLPAASSIILHVAIDEGLFAAQGLEVNLVPFRSTVELSSAMRAGMLDGHFTDIVTVLLQNETGVPQQIVATVARSTTQHRNFGIAVSQKSSIQSPNDLKNTPIAISKATIIEFLASRLLQKAHLPPTSCPLTDINRIALRTQLLMSNKIEAALLVEPLLSLAESNGSKVILDDKGLNLVFAVIALRKEVLSDNIAQSFRNALLEAAKRINANPDTYRTLMVNKDLLPQDVVMTFAMPFFDIEKEPLPNSADIETFANWMISSKLLQTSPSYEEIVLQ
ncbi:thiamine biosynthesis protein [Lawsonia intracellularis]|uniref:ABC transporter substrate-binding protein n=1 Tax=Lawsonia intracellularis TaxID=29546 RepID=UPI0009779555|nr:MetQ/NlpA family ABC transporter substrate-binding protein [Lawsonia intracellularis]OMQ06120.1 thiamine biosynthesis protein [Lawsonia intracellularis]